MSHAPGGSPEVLSGVLAAPIAGVRLHLPRSAWQSIAGSPLALWGAALLAFLMLFCFVGPLVYHGDVYAIRMAMTLQGPSVAAPLGTDALGRDILARLMVGGQLLIEISFLAAIAASLLGSLVGIVAGYFGGFADAVLMRLVDAILGLPQIVPMLFLTVIAFVTPFSMVLVIGLTAWPTVARLVRAAVLAVRGETFVESAIATGATAPRIIARHILPNVGRTLLVAATDQVGIAAVLLATVAFLGFGLPPPTPNWAHMVESSASYVLGGNWLLLFLPGACLAMLEIGVFFLGDGLRQALDPRRQGGGR